MGSIFIVAETEDGKLRESSLELVTLAREIAGPSGDEVRGVVLGAEPRPAAEDLAERGGIPVIAVADPLLAEYTADGYTAALAKLVAERSPELILATHGPRGWDWLPRLAARCDGAAASECVGVETDGDELVFVRKSFNAKLDMRVKLTGSPKCVSVQRGVREAPSGGEAGTVEDFTPGLADSDVRGRFVERKESAGESKVDLTQADVIVSGGRALGGPEKFDIIEELAKALGGHVGASRPVTDAGWLPAERQVGSSGVTVKPKLYVACGISGAIQHVVGMKSADFIIAINKDPRAPIFEVADVGVVGDLFEIVPALTSAVQEAKG